MLRAYKYRIYPTDQQKAYFAKAFGCCRYAYNFCVREHKRAWEEEGKTLYEYDLIKLLTAHKKNISWLHEADSAMLHWAGIRVVSGYDAYFNSLQNKKSKIYRNPPHEHKRGDRLYQSYTTCGHLKVCFRQNLIQLPLVGFVRAKLHRRFYGLIKHATVKQTASGQYYVSLCVDTRDGQVSMKPFDRDKALGIDLGVRHFATLSTGKHIDMPDVSRSQNRKAFLQRRLKHQNEGSKGYEKTRLQIAHISEHIANVRLDFHHKKAKELCDRYSTICIETLNVEGMKQGVGEKKSVKNNGFNRQLSHVGLGQFSRIIEEKAIRTGTHFTRIDRWEPTTKRCHVCGYINKDITLDVKEWTCPECGTHHDRDINAAINIKNFAAEQTRVPVEEKQLDDEKIKKQLPPVLGKDRSAKGSGDTDRKTEKVTGKNIRQPSTQIDDGSTHPRLAKIPEPLSCIYLHRFARTFNISPCLILTWLNDGVKYGEKSDFDYFLDCLQELANSCRGFMDSLIFILNSDNLHTTQRQLMCDALLEMNKLIDMATWSELTFRHGKPFSWWRNVRKTYEEMTTICEYYTRIVPEQIESYINRYRPV